MAAHVDPWQRALGRGWVHRGFDDPSSANTHLHLRAQRTDAVSRESVAGTLKAVSDLSGWWADVGSHDTDDPVLRGFTLAVVRELMTTLGALERALGSGGQEVTT